VIKMAVLHKTREYTKHITILLIMILISISNTAICESELKSLSATGINSKGPAGVSTQTDKYVNINKELIPEKDFYFPSESLYIFTEIQFSRFSDPFWKLQHFEISEVVDENLGLDNNSVRCAIISDIADGNIYRHNPDLWVRDPSVKITSKDNKSFRISIPTIIVPQRVVYWYKVTVKEHGTFIADTTARPGQGSDFYQDADQSLRIQVSNYDLWGQHLAFLEGIIGILIIFSGIFVFYKQIKEEKVDDKYHLTNLFLGMFTEIRCIVIAIPYRLIIFAYLFIFFFYGYSYISTRDPQHYMPIDMFIYYNFDYIVKALPISILIIITMYRLNLDLKLKNNLPNVCRNPKLLIFHVVALSGILLFFYLVTRLE
jgi:hypothetical protein